jgi:hypothetical protein
MAEIYAGCLLERLPNAAVAKGLRFFEYAPRGALPTLATLARAAKQLPKNQPRALVCPRDTWLSPKGPFRPSPELDAGFDWIKRAADIISARAIVLATGAELSTGERDRGLLAQFVERLKPTGRLIVVAPRGLWEAEHGNAFARQTGCIYGFDPLEDDAPEGEIVYARVRPMGARPRLTEGHLAQIAERLLAAGATTTYVAIESAQAARDAKRLDKATRELATDFDAGSDEDEEEEEEEEETDDEQVESDDEQSDDASEDEDATGDDETGDDETGDDETGDDETGDDDGEDDD